jgi:alpha-mannosidase
LEVEAPRAGYRILRIERASGRMRGIRSVDRKASQRAEIENEQLRVWAEERGIFVEDNATGRTLGPVYFSHAGDAGDEYTAAPVPGKPVLFAPDHTRARVTRDGLGERLELPIRVTVPRRLKIDRRTRTGRVRLDGNMVVRLIDGRAEIDLSLENRAEDFDLRLVAHVPGAETARSGAPFGVEDRAFEVDHSSPTAPQQWLPDFPMRGWVAAQDASGAGMAVLARGLYEAAVRKVEGGVDVMPTLLRGVGRLSRSDLETRPGHAGPEILTPDAQCLGPQHWELALLPFGPGEIDSVPAKTEQFLRPPAAFPVQWSAGKGPAEMEMFDGDPMLVVSALKPADGGEGAMMHAHNPTRQERQARVEGQRSRLDESPVEGDGRLGAFEIAAWRLNNGG